MQTPPPRVVSPEPVAVPEPVQRPVPIRRSPVPKALGFAAAGVAALGVMAAVVPSSQDDYGSIYGEEQFSVDDGAPAADYELAAPGVRKFVRRYRAKFHTSEAYRVALFSYRVDVQAPVIDGPTGTFDLDTLDVAQLFENIGVATGDLVVTDAEVRRVEPVGTPVGSGSVTIHVRNGRGDTATLQTTPQGSRTKAVPDAG